MPNIENLITLKANVERTIDKAIYNIQRLTQLEAEVVRLKEVIKGLEEANSDMDRDNHDLKNRARLEAGVIL